MHTEIWWGNVREGDHLGHLRWKSLFFSLFSLSTFSFVKGYVRNSFLLFHVTFIDCFRNPPLHFCLYFVYL